MPVTSIKTVRHTCSLRKLDPNISLEPYHRTSPRSCGTSGPVSTGMVTVRGGSSRVRIVAVFNQQPRPTQPGHPSVGMQNKTGDTTTTCKEKRRILRNNICHVTIYRSTGLLAYSTDLG